MDRAHLLGLVDQAERGADLVAGLSVLVASGRQTPSRLHVSAPPRHIPESSRGVE
ncbi:hypothetical protein ACIGHB_29745 [Streptomyces sp. NPDC085460]|uniref:hypothetical protein n=1 Tax=Streptomyces sp. NPDC085460 TaxID=3365723 RepID=UPI0037D40FB4